MRSKSPSLIVEEQAWLDKPAIVVQSAFGRAYDSLGRAKEPVRMALNGDWMGHPLHPAIVIAPLGAFATATALDMVETVSKELGLDKAVDACIELGLVTSLAAAATGATQWYGMKNRELRRVGLTHATMNTVALGLYGASLLVRKAKKKKLGKLFALAGLVVLTYSGYLGGHMVYQRRAGVE